MLLGVVLLIGGILLIVWGADWFTNGAIRTAVTMAVSLFFVGLVVSGLEPENLTTGVTAALERLPQIALGTVIGSAIFLLTAGARPHAAPCADGDPDPPGGRRGHAR